MKHSKRLVIVTLVVLVASFMFSCAEEIGNTQLTVPVYLQEGVEGSVRSKGDMISLELDLTTEEREALHISEQSSISVYGINVSGGPVVARSDESGIASFCVKKINSALQGALAGEYVSEIDPKFLDIFWILISPSGGISFDGDGESDGTVVGESGQGNPILDTNGDGVGDTVVNKKTGAKLVNVNGDESFGSDGDIYVNPEGVVSIIRGGSTVVIGSGNVKIVIVNKGEICEYHETSGSQNIKTTLETFLFGNEDAFDLGSSYLTVGKIDPDNHRQRIQEIKKLLLKSYHSMFFSFPEGF